MTFPAIRRAFVGISVLLALSVNFDTRAEDIELPANLSPALRARLLAQNQVPQQEVVPEMPATDPASAQPSEAAPAAVTPTQVTPDAQPSPDPPAPAATPQIILPGGATAQPPTRNRPRPGFPAGTPGAATPASAAPNPPSDPNDFTLAFTGNPIEEVLEVYQMVSGHHVIRDQGLSGTVVVVQNPNIKMTRDQAMDFIKASLLIQGYSLQEYTPGIDKIIQITNKPPLLEGPLKGSPIYMSAEELPETDEPVNYLIRLNYLSAVDASQVFANAIPNHPWGAYTAIPSANAILVRGSVPNIRSLIKIKDKVDVEPVAQVHEFVELERASAEDIQALLDGILQAQSQASAGAGGSTGFRPVAQPQSPNQPITTQPANASGPGTSSSTMPDGKSVIIKADPRTNRIFINGPKVHVDYLIKLVKEFDQPSKVKNLLTQQLRYLPVDDFIDIAAASLEARGLGTVGQSSGSAGGASSTGGSRTASTAGQNQFGGGGSTRGGSTSGFGSNSGFGANNGTGGTSSRNGSTGGSSSAGSQSTAALPRSTVVGKTLLISDPRMNSLLVTGPPESIERISELIKEMDKRPLQVHINAVIAQVTLDDTITTGADLLRRVEDVQIGGQNVSLAGLYSTTGGRTFLDPANLDTIEGFTSAAEGLNLYGTVGELFNAYVTALEKTGQFKVLSKPHVATANNETAQISVGSRVPIPSNQQSSIVAGGTTAVTSNIEYEDVDLVLEVTPLINSKNEITIIVNQQNNTVAGSTLINGNAIPNILTQSLNNKIAVPNGAIFTIGGSITESKNQSVTGLPFISKIPLLKHLFGSTSHTTKRQELIIMIQPRIIDTAADMVDVHTTEIQRTVIGPEAETFAKPDRDTSEVILPAYEKDIPFDAAGYPNGNSPATKNLFQRFRDSLKAR